MSNMCGCYGRYQVIAELKAKGFAPAIMGEYQSRFDANAVAAAWNRGNGDVATYVVIDQDGED